MLGEKGKLELFALCYIVSELEEIIHFQSFIKLMGLNFEINNFLRSFMVVYLW